MRDFLQAMGICGICATVGLLLIIGVTSAVSKEPTTLDDAINRPVVIKKYVDHANGVVCYWNKRHPGELECVKVTNTSKRHAQ